MITEDFRQSSQPVPKQELSFREAVVLEKYDEPSAEKENEAALE
jgi:hypothetical protein